MKKIKLKPWSSIGEEEAQAAYDATLNGPLSGFLGGVPSGGAMVRELDCQWATHYGPTYSAVSVNSATSGLLIALKALGVCPGDEVIVSPFSMSAGIAGVLWCGATPVFADIGEDFNLDPDAINQAINSKTAACLITNLFGKVATPGSLDIPYIEDNAQAPLTTGHFGDIIVDSLNVHKPLQAGEGGICLTEDHDLWVHMLDLRNHGEMAGGPPGLNLRMTEVTAAIALEQLNKGESIINERRALIKQLIEGVSDIKTLFVAPYDPNHVYYIWAVTATSPVARTRLLRDLNNCGVPVRPYVEPLYNLPAFQSYRTICPRCEDISKRIVCFEPYSWDINSKNINQIIDAFYEVTR